MSHGKATWWQVAIALTLIPAVIGVFAYMESSRDAKAADTVMQFLDAVRDRQFDRAYAMMHPAYRERHTAEEFRGFPFIQRVAGGEPLTIGEAVAPTKWVQRSASFTLGTDSGEVDYDCERDKNNRLGDRIWITGFRIAP